MKLASIVVPVYNIEKYIEKCIESLISQTYKNIEIILVDDGAIDNSGRICDIYAKKDSRIRVLHKENGGLSDARNKGVQECCGEYLFFVDGDAAYLRDYFQPDELERIFINFCDPWPSNRHARRRLTHEQFLILYRGILREGGQIHFKTDNRDLFEYSLFQFPKAGYVLSEVTRDLHGQGICGVMTDYEEKFHNQGMTINRCVGTKQHLDDEPVYIPSGVLTQQQQNED